MQQRQSLVDQTMVTDFISRIILKQFNMHIKQNISKFSLHGGEECPGDALTPSSKSNAPASKLSHTLGQFVSLLRGGINTGAQQVMCSAQIGKKQHHQLGGCICCESSYSLMEILRRGGKKYCQSDPNSSCAFLCNGAA